MKRLFASLAILAFLAAPTSAKSTFQSFWLKRVLPITSITRQHPVCTAFSVNESKGYWMTAAHCLAVGEDGQLDGQALEVLAADPEIDLAVLTGPRRPAFQLATTAPEIGDDVVVIGYAFGSRSPLVLFGRMSNPAANVYEGVTLSVVDLTSGGGASGGPTIDASGRVFCVHQLGNGGLSACNTFPVFKAFAEKFFEQ